MALTLVDIVPLSIDAVQVSNSLGIIYTSPASEGGTLIDSLYIINDTTTAVTCTIHNAPSGGSGDATNLVVNTISVPGDGLPVWIATAKKPLRVEADGTIEAVASAANQVTIQGGGLEYKI